MARLPNFLVIIRSEKLSGKGQGRGCLGVRKKERFVLGKRTFRSQKSKHFVLRIIQSNLKWNVNAGIGMSNWYGDDTDGTDAKFAYKVGIGLEVPFANTNIWSFQTGLNFISKGVKGDGVTDAWDVVDVTINQLYLELPLMVGARIHTASNFDLLFKGGPYLAYGVGGKTKIDGVSEKADTFGDDGLKRFDAGLGLGVAFEFGNIVVGVETGTSFTKVASGVSAHNLSALATIGYKF